MVDFFILYSYTMERIIVTLIMVLFTKSLLVASDLVFTPINVSHGLSDNQIRYILQLPDGRMVFTTSGSINLFDGSRFKCIHRSDSHIYPLRKYKGYYRIYQDGDSLLWIKDQGKLMCLDLRKERYMQNLEDYFRGWGIQQPVEDVFVDDQCKLWLLTSEGLSCPNIQKRFGLFDNTGELQDLMTDNDNVYLFYNTGQIVCYDVVTQTKFYSKAPYSKGEQSMFESTSLVVKGKGGIYQLRNGSRGGLFFFDLKKREWERLLETDYTLNTLIVTPDETAYVSCKQGFWVIDRQSGSKLYYPILKTVDGNVIDTEISTLFYDKQGGLWLGTLNRGLLYYHSSRYKFVYIGRPYFPESNRQQDIIVQAFAEDEDGNLYIKCRSGIYLYDSKGEKDKTLRAIKSNAVPKEMMKELNLNVEHTFEGKSYTALCTDTRGWTWGGTKDGLELIVPDTQERHVFYKEDGLSNNFVHAILEDKHRNIWVTTSYGMSRISVELSEGKLYFTNFMPNDGALNSEYIENAAFEAKDGTLYFGGIDGFNILLTDEISFSDLPFGPVFTALRLYGEEVIPGNLYDGRVILSNAAPYTDGIELAYNQNFLTFEFSAPNYQNQSQTYYRYFLEGIDSEWCETTLEGRKGNYPTDGILQVSYTDLSPGKYTLKVMATGNNHQWAGDVSTLYIRIHAPWWKTNTAYILYIVFFLFAVAGCICSYIHITKKRLERQHKEEMLLLRIKNLIEQLNQYESGIQFKQEVGEEQQEVSVIVSGDLLQSEQRVFSSEEMDFLTCAIKLVEKNLNTQGYSVELLSRDLCMDRTGLYRKLTNLLDESPSLFIRNIRLQRAAQLLLENELSITEIAETVGFSSTSYMSKCFQEMYGCRPSEYAENLKKST